MFLIQQLAGLFNFNPRTHEECDGQSPRQQSFDKRFQSTHSRGVRHFPHPTNPNDRDISIHALTRSATWRMNWGCRYNCRFQSTHSRGVRQDEALALYQSGIFQSTHSRGVRRGSRMFYFDKENISFHALTRSATRRGIRA